MFTEARYGSVQREAIVKVRILISKCFFSSSILLGVFAAPFRSSCTCGGAPQGDVVREWRMMTKDLRAQTDRRYIRVCVCVCVCVCVFQGDLSGLSQMPSTCLESLSHPVQMHKAVRVCVWGCACVCLKIKARLVEARSRPEKGFSAVSHSGWWGQVFSGTSWRSPCWPRSQTSCLTGSSLSWGVTR